MGAENSMTEAEAVLKKKGFKSEDYSFDHRPENLLAGLRWKCRISGETGSFTGHGDSPYAAVLRAIAYGAIPKKEEHCHV